MHQAAAAYPRPMAAGLVPVRQWLRSHHAPDRPSLTSRSLPAVVSRGHSAGRAALSCILQDRHAPCQRRPPVKECLVTLQPSASRQAKSASRPEWRTNQIANRKAPIVPIGGRRPLAYVGRLPCAHPRLSARHLLQDLIRDGREGWPKRSMYLAAIRFFPAVRRPPSAPVLHPPRITLLASQLSPSRTRQKPPSPPVKINLTAERNRRICANLQPQWARSI